MKDSTRRALRSGYHALLAVLALIPLLMSAVPTLGKATSLVAAIALVSKVVNTLEEKNLIPAWLKGDASPSEEVIQQDAPEGQDDAEEKGETAP